MGSIPYYQHLELQRKIFALSYINNHLFYWTIFPGADPTIQNEKKFTALQYAANNGYTECAEMLIDHGKAHVKKI